MANKKLYTIEEDIDLSEFEIDKLTDNFELSDLDGEDYVFLPISLLQSLMTIEHRRELYRLARELKYPLSTIKGYTDVILSGMAGELTEQQQKFLDIIKANAWEMHNIIDNMRDSARLDTGPLPVEKSPFQVMPMISETLRPFARLLADKEQIVDISIPDDLSLALGDETRFIQVLTNLISNAHKYTPDKGKIEINATQREGFIQISVTDTGIGIADDDLDKIFVESYFRSDHPTVKKQPGVGLGMILSKNFVERMGGKIWVESKLYKGSTFHFTIPIANEDTPDD